MSKSAQLLEKLEKLTEIGIALSSERDTQKLLELILLGAKEISLADGGTLYSVQEDNTIRMEIIRTDSLNYAMGGTTGNEIPFAPIPLFDETGRPNLHMVVTNAVLLDSTINIPDAYHADGFDFSGTKEFDEKTGYRSQSFLTVPLKNHQNEIIGVLQLLNATLPDNGRVIPFSTETQRLTESLASQAAIALTNRRLIDDLKALLESLIQLIATAIDEKSPYTGGHCERVPVLAMMLAEAADRQKSGPFKDFSLDADDRYELNIAAWLHDCGKITTPEAVVDKATKLQTIVDRIELIEARYEILKRDAQIAALEARLANAEAGVGDSSGEIERRLSQKLTQFEEELKFLRHTNIGGEFMSEDDQKRVISIGNQPLQIGENRETLLTENEIYNLTIAKGTLTQEEREIINNHIVVTIKMLEALPFPKQLKRVPEFAGGHHEKMDGSGYPKGLEGEQMSVQARILAIADIFEALTAKDRPYKEGKKLSETLKILGLMCREQHIDPELFQLFMDNQLYIKYAEEYLDPNQVDEIHLAEIPGYLAGYLKKSD